MNCNNHSFDFADLVSVTDGLHDYIRHSNYAGHDPFDGLESTVLRATRLLSRKWSRIVVQQAMKRLPVNLRGVLGVPKTCNPKGIALVTSALIKRYSATREARFLQEAESLADWLICEGNRDSNEVGWGYPFDWQSRTFFATKGTTNAICTVFCAEALLDVFSFTHAPRLLTVAERAMETLLARMLAQRGQDSFFRYVAHSDVPIHNVNLLAAALAARLGDVTGRKELWTIARQAIQYTVRRQRPNGSWPYGETSNLSWVDNFHTGFNLVALSRYRRFTESDEFVASRDRGSQFWAASFFLNDGTPKYFSDRTWPVDVHCLAQSIPTWLECFEHPANTEKAVQTARWAIAHLRDPAGFFYYQIHRWYVNRIPYFRWSQAWMFLALAFLINSLSISTTNPDANSLCEAHAHHDGSGGLRF